jgi:hypothetical protein
MMADPKSYRPGETWVIDLPFGGALGKGVFPRAFLAGPDTLGEPHWKELATAPTIVPERDGNTYHLKGLIPPGTDPGMYILRRVDILQSVTGMNDAKKIKSIYADGLDQFAIIVEKPPTSRSRDIPPILRSE